MTKEQIIKIVNACVQYNANQGTWSIDNRFADEFLTLIKQEKDDLLKEFVEWVKNNTNFLPIVIGILKRGCKNFLKERENYERLHGN